MKRKIENVDYSLDSSSEYSSSELDSGFESDIEHERCLNSRIIYFFKQGISSCISKIINFIYNFISSYTTLKVRLNDYNSKVPKKAEDGSAGYDVYSIENVIINPGGRQLVNIGISTEFPENYYLRCAPRSGLSSKYSIDVGAGVIDSSYRGEIKVLLINNGTTDYEINIGDKIAQLILERINNPIISVVEYLTESVRNNDGFGSTGT